MLQRLADSESLNSFGLKLRKSCATLRTWDQKVEFKVAQDLRDFPLTHPDRTHDHEFPHKTC